MGQANHPRTPGRGSGHACVPPTRNQARSRHAVAGAGGHVRVPPGERIARPAHRGRVWRTLTSAARGALPGYRGALRRGGRIHAPMSRADLKAQTARPPRPMRGGGCARVLAARHDVLAARLGGAMRTLPRAVRSAHSARASTWVGRGRGILAPSAERGRLPSHRGTVVEPQQPTGAGRACALPPAKHEARAPDTRAEARVAQQWHERVLPVHPADRGADGAQAPRARCQGWANTRSVLPSKREPCSRHAVGTFAERGGTGVRAHSHNAERSAPPPEVAELGVSIEPALTPHTKPSRGGVRGLPCGPPCIWRAWGGGGR